MKLPSSAAICVRNETADLARLSAFISDFCEREALPPDFDMALNLCAEEAFMNVVMHGFDEPGHEIVIVLTHEPGSVTLLVEDEAKPFNPLEAPEFDPSTPIENRRTGGLGIHLLRNLMDDLRYERVGGKNRLILQKNLPQ